MWGRRLGSTECLGLSKQAACQNAHLLALTDLPCKIQWIDTGVWGIGIVQNNSSGISNVIVFYAEL